MSLKIRFEKIVLMQVIMSIGLLIYSLANATMPCSKLSQIISQKKQKQTETLILFHSKDCPHCQKVCEYITQNNLKSELPIAEKEVFGSKANQQELISIAKKCKMDTQSIGLPLLWTKNRCIMGDKDIIDYLSRNRKENKD